MERIVYTLFMLIFLVSCRKEELKKIDGPSLADLNGKFSVINQLKVSKDSVNFSAGESVFFTAEFSKISSWKLEIIGQKSGAIKEIFGVGNKLTSVETTWGGATTYFPVFQSEFCTARLTFEGEKDTLTTTIRVKEPKVNKGFVVADFETSFNVGWTSFLQSGASMDFQIKSDETAPQGGGYLNMAGTVDWDWLIGLINFKATAYGVKTFPLSANPDNLYFNVLVWGEPSLTNSLVLFQFQEDENGDGKFSSNAEDMYSHQITINWTGWKLISIRYSELQSLVNGTPATASGNGVFEPNKLMQINMLHLANPKTGFAKSKLDYLIFTEGKPLEP
jgi:hypothetical protein